MRLSSDTGEIVSEVFDDDDGCESYSIKYDATLSLTTVGDEDGGTMKEDEGGGSDECGAVGKNDGGMRCESTCIRIDSFSSLNSRLGRFGELPGATVSVRGCCTPAEEAAEGAGVEAAAAVGMGSPRNAAICR